MNRYLSHKITEDLKNKMVLLGGPRQVGKTTLALSLLSKTADIEHPGYFNWDFAPDRRAILDANFPLNEKLIVLDEIHKYRPWRNLVKGFYDKLRKRHAFLITGSAKLDYYRRGGDSLLGRYHLFRLHPFSLFELHGKTANTKDVESLLKFGGFPEPLISADVEVWKRWRRERRQRLISEDLVNLEKVRELSQVDLLMTLLHERSGSLLSVNSLQEDLQASHEAISRWLDITENLYYCFRIRPWTHRAISGIRKEKKLFLWDWSECTSDGAKFETLVANNLLKYCHYHQDVYGEEYELFFVRDKAKRELDFIVSNGRNPLFAVECKSGEKTITKHAPYFLARGIVPMIYQVHLGTADYKSPNLNVRVIPYVTFVKEVLGI